MTLKQLLTGGPKPIWIRYLFILGVVTMITRLALDSRVCNHIIFLLLRPLYHRRHSLYVHSPA